MENTKLSPGNNFYQYINHKWLNDPSNQIPSDYSSWGGFTKLYDDGLINQINIVKNLENNCHTEEVEKIFAIWQASKKDLILGKMVQVIVIQY